MSINLIAAAIGSCSLIDYMIREQTTTKYSLFSWEQLFQVGATMLVWSVPGLKLQIPLCTMLNFARPCDNNFTICPEFAS